MLKCKDIPFPTTVLSVASIIQQEWFFLTLGKCLQWLLPVTLIPYQTTEKAERVNAQEIFQAHEELLDQHAPVKKEKCVKSYFRTAC